VISESNTCLDGSLKAFPKPKPIKKTTHPQKAGLSNGVNLDVIEGSQRFVEMAGRQIAGIF